MPEPSTSYNLLLNALSDGPKTEKELRKFADENKLFFGMGVPLTLALLQLRYPGTDLGIQINGETILAARVVRNPQRQSLTKKVKLGLLPKSAVHI